MEREDNDNSGEILILTLKYFLKLRKYQLLKTIEVVMSTNSVGINPISLILKTKLKKNPSAEND